MKRSHSRVSGVSLGRRKGSRVNAAQPVLALAILLAVVAAVVVVIVIVVYAPRGSTITTPPPLVIVQVEKAAAPPPPPQQEPPQHPSHADEEEHRPLPSPPQQLQQQLQQQRSTPRPDTLVITTEMGTVRIVLLPALSSESVEYIHRMTTVPCDRCNFYRAEPKSLFQGVMQTKTIAVPSQKGACPPDVIPQHNCPSSSSSLCACHGPLMERGMVAWAGGTTGPDFFVHLLPATATWWGTQHTVFGQIRDDASFHVLDQVWNRPAANKGGMTMLETPIPFTMRLE